jgi:hypothetical protein
VTAVSSLVVFLILSSYANSTSPDAALTASLPFLLLVAMLPALVAGYLAPGVGGFIVACVGAEAGLAVLLVPAALNYQATGDELAGLATTALLIVAAVLPLAVAPGWIVARLAVRALPPGGVRPSFWRRLAVYAGPAAVVCGLVVLAVAGNRLTIGAGRQGSCPSMSAPPSLQGHLAFVGHHAICVADLATGTVQVAYASGTSADETLDSPSWSPDGKRLVFVRTNEQPGSTVGPPLVELVMVDLGGGAPATVAGPPGAASYAGVAWSPNGDQLATAADGSGCSGCGELWTLDIASDSWNRVPLPSDVRDVTYPAWSQDARRIAFDTPSEDPMSPFFGPLIVISMTAGTTTATSVADAQTLSPAAWSQDGRTFAVARAVGGQGDSAVFIVAAEGTNAVRLGKPSDSQIMDYPCWMAGDRYVALQRYASNELPHAIWFVPAAGGDPALLVEGGTQPAWTAN